MSGQIRWLVDENLSKELAESLRRAGDDVKRQAITGRGIPDPVVLAMAFAEGRILITGDKGFGELVNLRQLQAVGVVLLREGGLTMAEVEREVLRRRDELAAAQPGAFITVAGTRIRVRAISADSHSLRVE